MDLQPQWRGQRDTRRLRMIAMAALSLLLHAPFTPLAGLLGLFAFLGGPPPEEVPHEDPITAIPIDLLEQNADPGASSAPEPPPPEPEPEPATAAEPTPSKPRKPPPIVADAGPEPVDAGVDAETPDAESDAGSDAGPEVADAGADAGADGGVAEAADAGDGGSSTGAGIADPVALSGAAGRIANSNANVRVIVYTEKIRAHPLGGEVSALLGAVDQWRDFFGPAGIDPVRDIDRILIAGSQLRDSADVVAVLRYNTTQQKIRTAIDALVQRDPSGGWIPDAAVPAARARADRAERLFVLPAPNLVVVTPPSAAKSALRLPRTTSFPPGKGEEVVSAYIVTPWRALIGLPFRIPRSIKWTRIKVTPTASGGALIGFEAEDESDTLASENARLLEDAIRASTQINLGIIGFKMIERVSFSAEGVRINGEVSVTAGQLRQMLSMVRSYAQSLAARRAGNAASTSTNSDNDAGTPSRPPPVLPKPMPKPLPTQGVPR